MNLIYGKAALQRLYKKSALQIILNWINVNEQKILNKYILVK